MHSETGFLSIIDKENHIAQLNLCHPFSLNEIEEGQFNEN